MQCEPLTCRAIGTYRSAAANKQDVPRQGVLDETLEGSIQLADDPRYALALRDLEGFSHIWVLFQFDRVDRWKPIVRPPRGEGRRGLFATRSPHRPNPIGLSCVRLRRVDGLTLHVSGADLLDGTPILDIKPYLPYADAWPDADAGWTQDLDEIVYEVRWTAEAQNQAAQLLEMGGPELATLTRELLRLSPYPHPSRRIRQLENGQWELAYKTWRIRFSRTETPAEVVVTGIHTGYSASDLLNISEDRWGDKALHRSVCALFDADELL